MNRLYRSKSNRVLFGVCGGLGEYFRIDPTIIRIICILAGFTGTGILIYFIASIIIPDEGKGAGSDSGRRANEWNSGTSGYSGGFTGSTGGTGSTGSTENTGSTGDYSGSADNFGGSSDNFSSGGGKYTDSFTNDFGTGDKWDEPVKYNSEKNKYIFGIILVGLGVIILGRHFIPALFRADYLVPLLLIGVGGIIVYKGRRQ